MEERYHAGPSATGTYGEGDRAGPAPGQAESVPEVETMEQAKQMVTDTAGQLGGVLQEQVDKGYQRAGEMLGGVLNDLEEVAKVLDERGQHQAGSLIHSVAGRAERVTDYVEHGSPQELLSDANEYARKHMWTVAAAGVAIGLLTSRFMKAATGGTSSPSTGPYTPASAHATVTGYPSGTNGGAVGQPQPGQW